MGSEESKFVEYGGLVFLIILAVLPHAGMLENGFVYDDIHVVLENPLVDRPFDIVGHFTNGFWGEAYESISSWRPLTTLSFTFDRAVFGEGAFGHHLVDLLLHAASTLVVFFLARELGLPRFVAAGCAAVWAVHPVHVEAIATIVGRADQWMTLFACAAILMWLRGRRLVAIGLIALALLSKEMAIVVPFVLAGYHGHEDERSWKWPTALMALVGGYLALRYALLGVFSGEPTYVENPIAHQAWPEKIWSIGVVHLEAWRLMVAPFELSHEYSLAVIPVQSSASLASVAGLVLLIVVLAVTTRAIRTRPRIFVGVGLWTSCYLLVSHIVVDLPMVLAERVFYLPTVGLVVAAGLFYERHGQRLSKPLAALTAVTVIAFAFVSKDRVRVWESSDTLYASAIETTPNSIKVLTQRAAQLARDGELEPAKDLIERSLSIYDQWHVTWSEIARVHIIEGDADRAAKAIARARELGEGEVEATRLWCHWGSRFDPARAVEWCETALDAPRPDADLWMFLAISQDKTGATVEAMDSFGRMLEVAAPETRRHQLVNYVTFLARHRKFEALSPAVDELGRRFGEHEEVRALVQKVRDLQPR